MNYIHKSVLIPDPIDPPTSRVCLLVDDLDTFRMMGSLAPSYEDIIGRVKDTFPLLEHAYGGYKTVAGPQRPSGFRPNAGEEKWRQRTGG